MRERRGGKGERKRGREQMSPPTLLIRFLHPLTLWLGIFSQSFLYLFVTTTSATDSKSFPCSPKLWTRLPTIADGTARHAIDGYTSDNSDRRIRSLSVRRGQGRYLNQWRYRDTECSTCTEMTFRRQIHDDNNRCVERVERGGG